MPFFLEDGKEALGRDLWKDLCILAGYVGWKQASGFMMVGVITEVECLLT